jgi:hypothetical protein
VRQVQPCRRAGHLRYWHTALHLLLMLLDDCKGCLHALLIPLQACSVKRRRRLAGPLDSRAVTPDARPCGPPTTVQLRLSHRQGQEEEPLPSRLDGVLEQ